jgi:hypothetical protein
MFRLDNPTQCFSPAFDTRTLGSDEDVSGRRPEVEPTISAGKQAQKGLALFAGSEAS